MRASAEHGGARSAGPGSLAQRELIGLRARVVASGHRNYLGLEGRVVDETMKTFTLDTSTKEVLVPKQGQVFEFTISGGQRETLQGKDLVHRPEDRTRKARPRPSRRAPPKD
ncbi:MAG TPA: ribonuclease P protein subunit [Candidatus Thermoplasmatota archaeon]|jgi:ribonuclease P protein subunit POP4|nr:ribonuclease P protein subunit [Candidatus Thermoplasmatota archaeon]